MPFIYRTLNRFPPAASALERVKQEQASPLEQEWSVLSGDAQLGKEGNEGRWNEDENFKFVIFVHYYQDIFSSRHKRKVCKIFRTFAQYLTQRTAAQCRSHYQKMIIKHKTIAKLKKHYKSMYGEKAYAQELERFRTEWEVTHPPALKNTEEIKQFAEIAIQTDEPVPTVCENCQGVRSESEIGSTNTPIFSAYSFWGENGQFQAPSVNFFYWVPQYQVESP